MVGYSLSELQDMHFSDITPYEILNADMSQYFNVITASDWSGSTIEKKYIHRDSHIIDVYVSTVPVRKEDGQSIILLHWCLILPTVTAQKTIKRICRNSFCRRKRWRLLDVLPEVLHMILTTS